MADTAPVFESAPLSAADVSRWAEELAHPRPPGRAHVLPPAPVALEALVAPLADAAHDSPGDAVDDRRPEQGDQDAGGADDAGDDDSHGRRWLGRGAVAAGGAASLAVGAVLGGLLQGVPNLLTPPVSTGFPQAVASGAPAGSSPLTSALQLATSVSPVTGAIGRAPIAGATRTSGLSTTSTPTTTAVGGAAGSRTGGSSVGSPGSSAAGAAGAGASGAGTTTVGATGGGGGASGDGASSCTGVCAAVQGVSQSLSQIPGVGSAAAGALTQAGGTVSSVAGSTPPPAAPSTPDSPGTTPLPAPVSGVTSTVGEVLSGVEGSLGL